MPARRGPPAPGWGSADAQACASHGCVMLSGSSGTQKTRDIQKQGLFHDNIAPVEKQE